MNESPRAPLFSTANRRAGTLVVECERCNGRVRVNYMEFVRLHAPLWAWAPWRLHSRWMNCPACGHRTWLATHWFD
ncbi:MAG: hypothetical protein WCG37_03065 [Actinomycetes bacterium]